MLLQLSNFCRKRVQCRHKWSPNFYIYVDPTVLQQPSIPRQSYFVGENVSINGCRVKSTFFKDISISWIKDGRVIESNVKFTKEWNGTHYLLSTDNLQLNDAKFENSGRYNCRITTNGVNVNSEAVNLIVISKFLKFKRTLAFYIFK